MHARAVAISLFTAALFAPDFALGESKIQRWQNQNGWDEAATKDRGNQSDQEEAPTDSKRPPRPKTLALVYEDAELHTAPSASSPHFRGAHPRQPRSSRPFVLVGQKGDWVELRSFTTADVGRLAICPYTGLMDLQLHLYVHERDVASHIEVATLAKRLDPKSEYRLDRCRNSNAAAVATAPTEETASVELPDLMKIPYGRGAYLPPDVPLQWPSGKPAGKTRYAVPLPMSSEVQNGATCFRRSMIGAGVGDPERQRVLTLCTLTSSIVR